MRKNCWIVWALLACTSLCLQAYAETVVTLPVGADEHFTVQDADSNTLLRVEDGAVLTGPDVRLGSQASPIEFVVSDTVVMAVDYSDPRVGLMVGSNVSSSSAGCILFGQDNSMYGAMNASILGGRDNNLSIGFCNYYVSVPYFSVIGGGSYNVVSGSQNSVICGGTHNTITNASLGAVVIGGAYNQALQNYATVLGGQNNIASATNSLAAGYHATSSNRGAFVWADASSASTFPSRADNEFAIRAAGGVRIESALGATALANKKSRYADNNIVAWARVSKSSGLSATDHFGVESVDNTSEGTYVVTIDTPMTSGYQLIPMAVVEMDAMPTSADAARLIYVDQLNRSTNFNVYITNGSFAPTNSDFLFMVTGR